MDDLLKEAKEAFELCVLHEADNRAEALDDIRFARLGEQWPAEVRRKRELDARPCLTVNRLPAFIRLVLGMAPTDFGGRWWGREASPPPPPGG